jgi:hypothetical protein
MGPTRRAFLAAMGAAAAAAAVPGPLCAAAASPPRWPRTVAERTWLGLPDPRRHLRGVSSIAAQRPAGGAGLVLPEPETHERPDTEAPGTPGVGLEPPLAARFPDLRRRIVFEYYPWYGTDPWFHWNEAGRTPPLDIAATSMPRLGPYDSYDLRVIEQHARWMADTGIGAIDLSWWGRGDYTDLVVPRILDVMRDHDIKATFHLEPYREDRARRYLDDIEYLIREYGERRRWDALLLLDLGEGRVGPVFKSFRTILPREVQDCHGQTFLVPDYTPDADWRRQTDAVRELLREDFAQVYLLADSLDMGRTRACGFDGIAVYDNFVTPDQWDDLAFHASNVDLVFSFNVNPGYDGFVLRDVPADSCYRPPPFEPGGSHPDWRDTLARAHAQSLALRRIAESLDTTVAVQRRAESSNARQRFFLTYVNSFNEWHEGHQFEPAKDAADLTDDERRVGYHNPPDGQARLTHLASRVRALLSQTESPAPAVAR